MESIYNTAKFYFRGKNRVPLTPDCVYEARYPLIGVCDYTSTGGNKQRHNKGYIRRSMRRQ